VTIHICYLDVKQWATICIRCLRELTNVMHQIIENKVNNVSFYTTHNAWANVECVRRMEQIMNHVRHTGECLQWTQLVSCLVDDSEELETTLSKILLYLF
jgi:hypothetical protein